MKKIVSKVIDVQPATQTQAEAILGREIHNVLHQTDGYIVNGKWVPADFIDNQTMPYETEKEILKSFLHDVYRHREWLRNEYQSRHNSVRANRAIEWINDYIKLVRTIIDKTTH